MNEKNSKGLRLRAQDVALAAAGGVLRRVSACLVRLGRPGE